MKFEKQETPEHVYVVAYDTICGGQQATTTTDSEGNELIALYTKEEAEKDIKEDYQE